MLILRRFGLALAVVMTSGSVGLVAQPPNLAGRWTLVTESPAPRADQPPPIPPTAGSGWGREITITQDGERLAIERAQFSEYDGQPPMTFVYALDGSESRNVINMGRGPQEQTSRAAWKGDTLVITTRHAAGTALVIEVTQVFSIDASGTLVIETTRAGGTLAATKALYRKNN